MPSPKLLRNITISFMLLGFGFIATNIYLGGHHQPGLASLFFALGALCICGFAISTIVWMMAAAWIREPERPQMPMPGKPGMPGMPPGMQMMPGKPGGPGMPPGMKAPPGAPAAPAATIVRQDPAKPS